MLLTTKFPVLILDHDDTTVASTPAVNYPSWLEILSKLRPDHHPSYTEFVDYCFEPGFEPYCREILGFSDAEMAHELAVWQRFADLIVPDAFDGMRRIIERQRAAGGIVCVVSHSHERFIVRDWKENFGTLPDKIYSWDMGEEWRKPSVRPIEDISETFGFSPSQMLMVDDLRTGYDMARAVGVAFVGALWGQPSEKIRGFMRKNCKTCFDSTAMLEDFLFNE